MLFLVCVDRELYGWEQFGGVGELDNLLGRPILIWINGSPLNELVEYHKNLKVSGFEERTSEIVMTDFESSGSISTGNVVENFSTTTL